MDLIALTITHMTCGILINVTHDISNTPRGWLTWEANNINDYKNDLNVFNHRTLNVHVYL